MDSLHDCPATPISARALAVVKGLAASPIETMVLAARVQLSKLAVVIRV